MAVRRRKAVICCSVAGVVLLLLRLLLSFCERLRWTRYPYPPSKAAEPVVPGATTQYRSDVNLELYNHTWKKQEPTFSDFRYGHPGRAKILQQYCGFCPVVTEVKCRSTADKARKHDPGSWSSHTKTMLTFLYDAWFCLVNNLSSRCHGTSQAIITQTNTPLGSKVIYDGEKKYSEKVTPNIFATFAKEQPFDNVTWEICSVVGNGGILVNSSCGEEIDSAQLVIRCNLPPVGKQYAKDVGNKTNMVTANPSILLNKFEGLTGRRLPFVEYMGGYERSLLFLPAFSYTQNLLVCLRTMYTLEEAKSQVQPVFISPAYLQSLNDFWRDRGLQVQRLSTGLMVASLALERCTQVNLYGFWPYDWHPHSHRPLTNHYYDNQPFMPNTHDVPAEFRHLLQLHHQGVLKLHLDRCGPGQ